MKQRLPWPMTLVIVLFLGWAGNPQRFFCVAPAIPAMGDQGLVEEMVYRFGPYELKASTLQQVPNVGQLAFAEDIWLVGYRVDIEDEAGKSLSEELQCHTFFGNKMPSDHSHDEVLGLFSDAYTNNLRLPSGFGIPFKSGQKSIWIPMFNNRTPEARRALMKLTLQYVRAKPGTRFQELATTFRSVQVPHLYYVSPGKDVRESDFSLPFVGRIHVIGTHIHPYGVSIELVNTSRRETVWKGVGIRDDSDNLSAMPIYRSVAGYSVEASDRFKLIATYDNPTQRRIDAMAGIFILYSTGDSSAEN